MTTNPASADVRLVEYALPAGALSGVKAGAVTMGLSRPGLSGQHGKHPMVNDALTLVGADGGTLPAWCVARGRAIFNADGLLRLLGPFALGAAMANPDGEPQIALLTAAEQGQSQAAEHLDKLALAFGAPDYPTLWAQLKRDGGAKHGLAVREVVGWRLAQ